MSGINVKFGATDAGFTSTVSKVNGSMKGMDNNVRKVSGNIKSSFASMAKAGAALAVGFGAIKAAVSGVRAVADDLGQALDLGGKLNDLSARTGESAGNLLILQRAFDNTGAGADKVGPAINKMQRAIVEAGQGSATYQKAFDSLGLSLDQLKGKTPTEQFKLVSERLTAIQDPAERTTTAMQILGRSGGELLPFLTGFNTEIETAKDQLGNMPGVMDRSAAAFDKMSDELAVLKSKTTEVAAGFLQEAIPALMQYVEAGSKLDAAGFGQKIGEKLREAFYLITSGDVWELFKLRGQQAIAAIQTSEAMTGFAAFVNSLGDMLFSEKSENFNFTASFNKYMNAGVAANDDLTAEINAKMDALWQRQAKNAAAAAEEFNKTVAREKATKSADDIFKGIFADMEASSKKSQELTHNMMEDIKTLPPAGNFFRDKMIEASKATSKAAADIVKSLSLSEEITKRIKDAQAKDKVDPGGRLEKRAGEQIEKGQFRSASRTAGKIARGEQELDIQTAFGGEGKSRAFGKSIQDLAREQGISTFRKSSKELREELATRARQRGKEMLPGKQGMTPEEAARGGKAADDPLTMISKAVEEIRTLVKKIEPKLPTVALAN